MIAGLGGIFIYSENPKKLAGWYEKCFDLEYEYTEEYKAYYVSFPYREMGTETNRYSVFSILHVENRPFVNGKIFTINLRVKSIEKTLEKLNILNVSVQGPEHHDEGSFAWINDPEGNYIELWEDVEGEE